MAEKQKCRSCGAPIIEFLSLGNIPLVNSFLHKEDIPNEKTFKLSVAFCPECTLVQLTDTVPPEELFQNYVYFSSTSSSLVEHSRALAYYFSDRFQLNENSFVLEIASNDGVFLQFLKEQGIPILGVDPAENIAKVANERGIPTLPKFFNCALAERLSIEGKQVDFLYGANVLAHVPDIADFAKGVKTILKKDGTAVFEFPYLKGLMENKFDTIYHEHVFYYSLIALKNIFEKVDLEIYDVEHVATQGGSLVIYISHPNTFEITQNVIGLEEDEYEEGFAEIDTYKEIGSNVERLKGELLKLFEDIKKEKKTIAAYSAPAKGNVLLNYFGINEYHLSFIVDKSEAKQGLYTPGTHLLVHHPNKIYQEKPDYLLILCWNIADEVMDQLYEYRNGGGKFIIPVPSVKVI